MKKFLSLLLIFCLMFTFAACGKGGSNKKDEKIITDVSIFSDHNETVYSTPSKSTSKLAIPFKNETVGECIVTVDFDNIINENLAFGFGSIGSDAFAISSYDPENLVLDASVSAFTFKIELSTKTMETPELYRNGRWVLKKTDSGFQHHLYYIFDDSENEYNLRFMINTSDSETALLYAENFVNIFNYYKPVSSGNYTNVLDADGNSADLSDYRFFCDMAAMAISNGGLNVPNASYITHFTGGVLNINVPLEESNVNYAVSFTKELYLDSQSAIIDTFDMNDHTVNMAKTMGTNIKRYFVESGNYFIKINATYPNGITNGSRQKEILVDHFN